MILWLLQARGRRRLRRGFCPWCYSSPPRTGCPICGGAHHYGPGLTSAARQAWQRRWAVLMEAAA